MFCDLPIIVRRSTPGRGNRKVRYPMFSTLDHFIQDESGATALEYGLIAALVSVAAIGALQAVGTSVAAVFSMVSSTLSSAAVAGMTPAP